MKFTNEFIKNNRFLLDRFTNEIILSKNRDEFSPPERYHYVSCRDDDADIYIDTIWIDRNENKVIDFAYSHKEICKIDYPTFLEMLYSFLESKGLPRIPYDLRERNYPKKIFIELLKICYIKGGEH